MNHFACRARPWRGDCRIPEILDNLAGEKSLRVCKSGIGSVDWIVIYDRNKEVSLTLKMEPAISY